MKVCKEIGIVTIALTAFAARTLAGESAVDQQGATYTFHYFADSDDIRVYSHYYDYGINLKNNADLYFVWNNETVVIPPVDAAPGSDEAADAITSASRPVAGDLSAFEPYEKARDVVTASIDYGFTDAGYYVSIEEDYLAQQVSGNLNRDFLSESLNLSAGSSYGWDRIDPLADDDTPGGDDSRTNTYLNLVATQVVTPGTLIRIGAEVNEVRGLQHSPYRNVNAGGGTEPEVHPDVRSRRDFFLKLNRYFTNESSVHLSYKYYTDDWGIESHTLGARLNQYLNKNVIVRYRYRYYEQDEAWFYRDEYEASEGIGGYRSGDYRMTSFTAHLFGTHVDWALGSSIYGFRTIRQPRLIVRYERYFNSNNFSANIFESGFAVNF